jgi:hypothetical protein
VDDLSFEEFGDEAFDVALGLLGPKVCGGSMGCL